MSVEAARESLNTSLSLNTAAMTALGELSAEVLNGIQHVRELIEAGD